MLLTKGGTCRYPVRGSGRDEFRMNFRIAPMNSFHGWLCDTVMSCTWTCPRRSADSPHLSPAGRHLALGRGVVRRRREAVRRGGRNHHPARAWPLDLRGSAAQAWRADARAPQPLRHRAALGRRALDALELEQ